MKKTLLSIFFMSACVAMQLGAQTNLIENWDGNGAAGAGSEANYWGWSSSYTSATWGQAGGSGVRFRDLTNVAKSPSGTFSGREFLYRWDSPYNGATLSLGIGDGTSITSTSITLSANTSYTFSGLAEWVNNGAVPTYTFKLSDAKVEGNSITLGTHSCAAKNIFYPFSFTFQPTTLGTYYIQITQTAGFSGGVDLGGIIGLADLMLKVTPAPTGIASTDLNENVNVYTLSNTIVVNCDNVVDATITVYNAVGKQLHEQAIGVNKSVLNSKFAAGVYLVRVKNAFGSIVKKVVVK